MKNNSIIIYGGSFDPIHNGHINVANNIQNNLNFKKILFVPCKHSKFKYHKNFATDMQRIEMLKLAFLENKKNFSINYYELNKKTPSYTYVTLKYLRNKFGIHTPISMVMGTDVFNTIQFWFSWKKILNLSNLIIINRAGITINYSKTIKALIHKHKILDFNLLHHNTHGCIYFFNINSIYISSRLIRKYLNKKIIKKYIPKLVRNYIFKHKIYQ
ncbi:nicotinate (nicotinamide) nucleotide adenylyltransferase [Candidatus Legionella polyplacis]|uniref:Probable nicotinate-nucleotide adenylyltransferase n=1 Tax=Candidatus Legionella polyplacis TaxID=2005262 RepID=A0ABZ2GX10_9GAMM|nr:nicotinate (nicotinamide) nucleotide adenylyltransferase [Candidatus Legionella polyplacis]ATW01731.1 nicotinate (nicotinamide) nucleotide adenylyltransferase [Candidatus Legionella polyplacis]